MKGMVQVFIASVFVLSGVVAVAQGTVVFSNQSSILSSPPDRLVRFYGFPGVPDGTPFCTNYNGLNFSGYRAQLFYGAVADEFSLIAVTTAPASFRNSTSASVGTWFGGTRTLAGFGIGALVYLQVRVWDTSLAPDWNAAMLPGYDGQHGKSAIFTYTVPTSRTFGPDDFHMVNFQAFNVGIPEPAAPALLGLAALCFGMLRHGRLSR